MGEFFTYGKNSFSAGASNLDNTDYRLGVYGLREKGPQQTFVYFDIGRQTNDSKPDSQKREYDLQCSHFGHEYREKSAGFGDGEEELVNYRLEGSLYANVHRTKKGIRTFVRPLKGGGPPQAVVGCC